MAGGSNPPAGTRTRVGNSDGTVHEPRSAIPSDGRPAHPNRAAWCRLLGSLDPPDGQAERPALERLQCVAELLPGGPPPIDHHVVARPVVPPGQPALDLLVTHDPPVAMRRALQVL